MIQLKICLLGDKMAELAINQLIKTILVVVVIVIVITGVYFAFKNNIISFFEGLPGNSSGLIMGLI